MNDNQFMGLRIRFEGGGKTNNTRQSIRWAPDSMVEDARLTINSWGSELDLRVEDRRTALGNQLVGLQTRLWRMHEQR